MTNIYIHKMKNIAESYYNQVCKLRKTVEYNSHTYSRDLADKYNEEIEHQIVSEANSSIEEINAVFNELKAKISIRNFVSTENYSSNIAVFESGILNQEEFNILLQKYFSFPTYKYILLLMKKAEQYHLYNRSRFF